MKLFIADDNVEFREHLASILGDLDGVDIIGEAGDVPEAIESIRRTKPDTILLDIHMPGGSGLDVLKTVRSFTPSPAVIMLTVGPGSQYKEKCLAMGANFFFEKSSQLRDMTQLLKRLAKAPGSEPPAHSPSQSKKCEA